MNEEVQFRDLDSLLKHFGSVESLKDCIAWAADSYDYPDVMIEECLKHAAAQIAAELACLRDVETKLLLVRVRPPNAPSRSAIKPSTETLIE